MDELEKELAALRQATDRVTASQALKSELLLAVTRTGAGTAAATAGSLKLVVMLVAAAGIGGLTVWGVTREPEAAPPAPPSVSVSVTVVAPETPAVAAAPSPQAAAPAIAPQGAPMIEPTPPGTLQVEQVPSKAGAALIAEWIPCKGIAAHPKKVPLPNPLPADVAARVAELKKALTPRPIVLAHFSLPNGKTPADVVATVPLTADGWFVAHLLTPGLPVWFGLPGFMPISVETTREEQQFLGELWFVPSGMTSSQAELAVNVTAPYGAVSVSLTPQPCHDATGPRRVTDRPAIETREGRQVVFDGLAQMPWLVTARGPGNTTATTEITPTRAGRTDVRLTLESARQIEVEYTVAPFTEPCHSTDSGRRAVVPGEPFSISGKTRLRLLQKNQRVTFDSAFTALGAYLGNGTIPALCRNLSTVGQFPDREIVSGDVYRVYEMEGRNVVLMRFTVH